MTILYVAGILILFIVAWFAIDLVFNAALFLIFWPVEKVLRWFYDSGYRFGGLLRESDDPFNLR